MNVQLKPFQRQSEMGTGRPLSTSHPSHPPLAPQAQCPGQSGNFHSHFSDFQPSNGSHTFQTSLQSPSSGSNTTMGMNADSMSTHVFPPLPPMHAENSGGEWWQFEVPTCTASIPKYSNSRAAELSPSNEEF